MRLYHRGPLAEKDPLKNPEQWKGMCGFSSQGYIG